MKRSLRLPPGRYVLETAVQDRESGRLGARRARFEIPRVRAGAEPRQRGHRARRRGGERPARRRPAARGIAARNAAARPILPRGDAGRLAAAEPLRCRLPRRARRSSSSSGRTGRRSPTRSRSCRRRTQAGASRTSAASRRRPRRGALRGLGARPARRRGGHGGDGVHDHAASLARVGFAARPAGAGRVGSRPHPRARSRTQGVATPLATILERAGRYVREYETTFSNLVAEETYRQWGPDPRCDRRHDRPHPAVGPRVRPPDRPAALGHVPGRVRGRRTEGARPRAAAREALLRPEGLGLRAGAGDPRRELALQPRPRLPQRQHADPRPSVPASREPGPARVQAEGHAHDCRLPDGRGRLRGEDEPVARARPLEQRRAGERALLDRRDPRRRAAHRDRVRPRGRRRPELPSTPGSEDSSPRSTGATPHSAASCPTR